jgi:hypothetical protein
MEHHRQYKVTLSTTVSLSISDDHFLTFGTRTWAWIIANVARILCLLVIPSRTSYSTLRKYPFTLIIRVRYVPHQNMNIVNIVLPLYT